MTPFQSELYKHQQKNTIFSQLGYPHRYICNLEISLIQGQDMIACHLLSHSSDPYVFLNLHSASESGLPRTSSGSDDSTLLPTTLPNTWSLDTFRSRVGDTTPCTTSPSDTVTARWSTPRDTFHYSIALPVHPSLPSTSSSPKRGGSSSSSLSGAASEENALHVTCEEGRRQPPPSSHHHPHHHHRSRWATGCPGAGFASPPTTLSLCVYSKATLRAHPFMGHASVALDALTIEPTSRSRQEPLFRRTVPLWGVPSGSITISIRLSFELHHATSDGLMDSDIATAQEPSVSSYSG